MRQIRIRQLLAVLILAVSAAGQGTAAPALSWCDTEPQRCEIRRGAQKVLNKLDTAR